MDCPQKNRRQEKDRLSVVYPSLIRRAILAAGVLAAALAVDFLTKWLILNVVMVPPRTIAIAPFFNLTLGFNTGVSFGMFRELFLDRPMVLAGIKVVIVAGLLVWAMRTPKQTETISLSLIAGGASGNVLDRMRQGAVTDFLDFHVGSWHWPAFNMADTMITIGVVLLIAGSFWPVRSMSSVQKR
ncbi:signal peptidase II [Chelativorans intermedius]|uniref:Lipoprotein signal peptidase n=1 Tax=Chelativorans intermedius TaxID=515947 RepID=A0ABV6D833_9HYPH|nr:signal peptidase II [Chelativorans intermedius]MCT8999877.1 signal peptidase II [Chelativorans intermedius]